MRDEMSQGKKNGGKTRTKRLQISEKSVVEGILTIARQRGKS
jgi:hypothetical protein